MFATFRKNALSKGDIEYFKRTNPGFSVTGDVLGLYFDEGNETGYAVLKGLYTKHTRAGSV